MAGVTILSFPPALSNPTSWGARVVTVVTSGTPVQGLNIPIANSISVALISDKENSGNVYVANSSLNTGNTSARYVLRPAESLTLQITNSNLVWFDASANNQIINLIVEA